MGGVIGGGGGERRVGMGGGGGGAVMATKLLVFIKFTPSSLMMNKVWNPCATHSCPN